MRHLPLQCIRWRLLGRAVDAHVGDLAQPMRHLHVGGHDIESLAALRQAARQRHIERAAQVAVEAFHLALGLRPVGLAQLDDETAMLGVVQEAGMVAVRTVAVGVALLALAERGEIPRTPQALHVLAAERPHSNLLLARCWDMLNSRDHRNDRTMENANVGLILREHFSDDADVRQQLVERFKKTPCTATAIPLAIFAPDAKELLFSIDFDTLGHDFADWTVAVHLAACRANSADFCRLLEAMVTRRWRSEFDAQQITNLAVEERLQRDSELEALLSARIGQEVNPSISGSFARYLAAAGKLSLEARDRVVDLLQALSANQRLPIAGYDAISDQWRAVRATLLDAVSAGLELD